MKGHVDSMVEVVRSSNTEHIEINAIYNEVDDISPVIEAVAKVGLPGVRSLGIHIDFDEASYPLGDLPRLLSGLPNLEQMEARGTLENIVGVSSLRRLSLALTPLSETALASFEATTWPNVELLALKNDGRPFPDDFDVRRDAANLNALSWPQRPLPRLTRAQFPKLKALALNTGGDAYAALQNLVLEPTLLAGLSELRLFAGYISKRASDLLLEHANLFSGIEEFEVDGSAGWAIDGALGNAIEAALPNLLGVQPNSAFRNDSEDDVDEDSGETTADHPEFEALSAAEEIAFVWWRSTDELELSVDTQEAIMRFSAGGPGPALGEIGQVSPARLLQEYGWSMQNVVELKELLGQVGIVLGEPISAWDLERGRAIDG